MLINDRKSIAIGAGFVALAALAVVGWTRKPAETSAVQNQYVPGAAATQQSGTQQNTAAAYPIAQDADQPTQQRLQPVGYQSQAPVTNPCDSYPAAGRYQASNFARDGYYSSVQRPVYVHPAVYNPAPVYNPPVQNNFVETSPRGSGRVYRNDVIHTGRSGKKSAAIVAGTAGVGAAIGAVAAGGKGAALGALSGGGAGFVYDRLTHNH